MPNKHLNTDSNKFGSGLEIQTCFLFFTADRSIIGRIFWETIYYYLVNSTCIIYEPAIQFLVIFPEEKGSH